MICKYCGKTEAKKRGLCNACYMRWYRHGSCEYRKPKKSNADRVRSMSDEELAYYMMRTTKCPCEARASGCCRSDITCQKAWLDWLREEVKE